MLLFYVKPPTSFIKPHKGVRVSLPTFHYTFGSFLQVFQETTKLPKPQLNCTDYDSSERHRLYGLASIIFSEDISPLMRRHFDIVLSVSVPFFPNDPMRSVVGVSSGRVSHCCVATQI